MRAVVQRVTRAEVRVEQRSIARIGVGMLVFLGVMQGDGVRQARRLAERIARFRFFPDADGRMNRSALDVGAEALVVSQVTLAADGRKGRRPSLDSAAGADEAQALYGEFAAALAELGVSCATGAFGARMEVELTNDGPVTFFLEERPRPD